MQSSSSAVDVQHTRLRYHAATFAPLAANDDNGVDSDEEAFRSGCGPDDPFGALAPQGPSGRCEDVDTRRRDTALCLAAASCELSPADAVLARLWNLFIISSPPRPGPTGLRDAFFVFAVGPGARVVAGTPGGDAALARFALLLVENCDITTAQAAAAQSAARAGDSQASSGKGAADAGASSSW